MKILLEDGRYLQAMRLCDEAAPPKMTVEGESVKRDEWVQKTDLLELAVKDEVMIRDNAEWMAERIQNRLIKCFETMVMELLDRLKELAGEDWKLSINEAASDKYLQRLAKTIDKNFAKELKEYDEEMEEIEEDSKKNKRPAVFMAIQAMKLENQILKMTKTKIVKLHT